MPEKYVAKPVEVDAAQITEAFFDMSVEEQLDYLPKGQFIDVDAKRMSVRPSFSNEDAHIGDWVVAIGRTMKVVKGYHFAEEYAPQVFSAPSVGSGQTRQSDLHVHAYNESR